MATIDAAIIKALVEHIGMDPDDVGSGSSSSIINATWSTKEIQGHNCLAFTLPAGVELKNLTQIRFTYKETPTIVLTCYLLMTMEDDGIPVYMFKTLAPSLESVLEVRFMDGEYFTMLSTDTFAVPDNNKTGLFVGDSLSGLAHAVSDIIGRMKNT